VVTPPVTCVKEVGRRLLANLRKGETRPVWAATNSPSCCTAIRPRKAVAGTPRGLLRSTANTNSTNTVNAKSG